MCAGRANPTKEGQRKMLPLLCQMTPTPRPWTRLAIPMPRGLRRAVHLLHHPIHLMDPTPCPRLHLMLPPLRRWLCLYNVGRPEDSPAGWVLAYSADNGGNCMIGCTRHLAPVPTRCYRRSAGGSACITSGDKKIRLPVGSLHIPHIMEATV